MLRKKKSNNPKHFNPRSFGRVSIHNKIKQQSTKMSVHFKTLTKTPSTVSAGFSPVLAGATSTDSLGTNHTDRDTETLTTVMCYSTNIHSVGLTA